MAGKRNSGEHAARFLESPAKKGLVVFIHGIMGSPRHFDILADYIFQQGYSAASLLLPGHGCSAREFASGTAELWENHVVAEIEKLSREYSDILLVGHSMGGLLALNAAVRLSGHVQGVIVIASPFRLAIFSAKANISRLKFIFSSKSNPIKAASIAVLSIKASPSLLWHIFKPFFELKKLMRSTERMLPDVRTHVTAIYSRSDELVSLSSLDVLRSGLSGAAFEQIILSDASHGYYPEKERALIEQALLSRAAED